MIRRAGLAREVLGAPLVPPAGAASAVNNIRVALGRVRDRLAPAPLRVMDAALSWLDHAAVLALCELGVPDALDRRMPVATLADRVGADADQLTRLLRFAAARCWVRLDRRGRVRPTASLRFLATTHPGGWRAWIDFTGRPEVTAAGRGLGAAVAAGAEAFAHANGTTFFAWTAADPAASAAFDAAMAAGARLHGLALAAALPWQDVRSVCDVGGGTGALLATLTELHPHIHGTVLDLAHVIAAGAPNARVDFVAGDAFESVPPGHDVYLLVNVIHDWDDEAATRLLTTVAAAASAGGRIVIVEALRRERPVDDLAARADLLMLALAPGGRERTAAELHVLTARAGLRHFDTTALASTDAAHTYRVDR